MFAGFWQQKQTTEKQVKISTKKKRGLSNLVRSRSFLEIEDESSISLRLVRWNAIYNHKSLIYVKYLLVSSKCV